MPGRAADTSSLTRIGSRRPTPVTGSNRVQRVAARRRRRGASRRRSSAAVDRGEHCRSRSSAASPIAPAHRGAASPAACRSIGQHEPPRRAPSTGGRSRASSHAIADGSPATNAGGAKKRDEIGVVVSGRDLDGAGRGSACSTARSDTICGAIAAPATRIGSHASCRETLLRAPPRRGRRHPPRRSAPRRRNGARCATTTALGRLQSPSSTPARRARWSSLVASSTASRPLSRTSDNGCTPVNL